MVNTERIRLLVEALESGDYEQGQGHLNLGGKFCCLGVACEVAIANGLQVEKTTELYYGTNHMIVSYDGSSGFLPLSVANWYGFEGSESHIFGGRYNPIINVPGAGRVPAATANDAFGKTLPEIAEGFRREYLPEPV